MARDAPVGRRHSAPGVRSWTTLRFALRPESSVSRGDVAIDSSRSFVQRTPPPSLPLPPDLPSSLPRVPAPRDAPLGTPAAERDFRERDNCPCKPSQLRCSRSDVQDVFGTASPVFTRNGTASPPRSLHTSPCHTRPPPLSGRTSFRLSHSLQPE